MAEHKEPAPSIDVTVREHGDKEKSGKENVFTVVLSTPSDHNPHIKITIKSTSDIRDTYPLDQKFGVSLTTPQTKLQSSEDEE